jgi:hypothetical protein
VLHEHPCAGHMVLGTRRLELLPILYALLAAITGIGNGADAARGGCSASTYASTLQPGAEVRVQQVAHAAAVRVAARPLLPLPAVPQATALWGDVRDRLAMDALSLGHWLPRRE